LERRNKVPFFAVHKCGYYLQVMHLDHTGSVQKIKAYDNITMKGDAPEKKKTLGYGITHIPLKYRNGAILRLNIP